MAKPHGKTTHKTPHNKYRKKLVVLVSCVNCSCNHVWDGGGLSLEEGVATLAGLIGAHNSIKTRYNLYLASSDMRTEMLTLINSVSPEVNNSNVRRDFLIALATLQCWQSMAVNLLLRSAFVWASTSTRPLGKCDTLYLLKFAEVLPVVRSGTKGLRCETSHLE